MCKYKNVSLIGHRKIEITENLADKLEDKINMTDIIHEKYLGRKLTAEYSSILHENIETEKKLRSTLTNDQQILLNQLIDSYQSMQILDQTELIKFTSSLLKDLFN